MGVPDFWATEEQRNDHNESRIKDCFECAIADFGECEALKDEEIVNSKSVVVGDQRNVEMDIKEVEIVTVEKCWKELCITRKQVEKLGS